MSARTVVIAAPFEPAMSRVTQARVIRSEWIKLWSLRSTRLTLFFATLSVLTVGPLISALTDGKSPDGIVDPTSTSLGGTNIAQLVLGVLGALLFTSEHSSGLIRTTFTAVPRRLPVLWGKALVFTTVTAALMVLAVFAAFLVGQAVYAGEGVGTSLSDTGVVRAVLGAAAYPVLIGLMGVALGALLRHTSGAIALLFGVLFLAPSLSNLLGAWAEGSTKFLPSQAGQAVTTVVENPGLLSPIAGLLVLVAWAAVALGAAAVQLQRRDA